MTMIERWKNRCRITEEWDGFYIGRKHYHTHNVKWEDQNLCPKEGQPIE